MQAPDVWSDQNKVSKLGTEIKEIKENISFLDRWSSAIDDAGVALEIQDEDLVAESFETLKKVSKELDKFEIKLMLSGEYDEADAILTINAGAGGTDAQDWASMLLRMYMEMCLIKHSCRFEAGSVLISSIFFPLSAKPTAVAQAIEVFPTPPFPVKKRYFVKSISDKLNVFIFI